MDTHTELEHRDFNTLRGQAAHDRPGSWGVGCVGLWGCGVEGLIIEVGFTETTQ